MVEDGLDAFVKDIIVAKGLPGLNDEVFIQLHQDLKAKLIDQINAALVDALDEQSLDKLNEMLDNAELSDQQIQEFVEAAGVDTKAIAAQTMIRFRDLYIGANTNNG